MKLVVETFTCGKADSRVEYGFTFKRDHGDDDGVFDLVIGEVTIVAGLEDAIKLAMKKSWRKYKPMANAIAKVGVVPPNTGMFFEGV